MRSGPSTPAASDRIARSRQLLAISRTESITLTARSHKTRISQLTRLATWLAAAFLLTALSVSPALAKKHDWDDEDEHHREEWHREHHKHWHEYEPHVYSPPPVVYGPPPAVYAPPPPIVYAPVPTLNLVISFPIH